MSKTRAVLQSHHDNHVKKKKAVDGNATLLNKLSKQSLVDLAAHHKAICLSHARDKVSMI